MRSGPGGRLGSSLIPGAALLAVDRCLGARSSCCRQEDAVPVASQPLLRRIRAWTRELRRKEERAARELQAGRVAALADLLALHGPGHFKAARLERAAWHAVASRIRYARAEHAVRFLQKTYPEATVIMRASPDTWIPMTAVQLLLERAHRGDPIVLISSADGLSEVRVRLRRRRRSRLNRTLASIRQAASRPGTLIELEQSSSGEILILMPQEPIERRFRQALDEAGQLVKGGSSSFQDRGHKPDRSTYISIGDEQIWKIRLSFVYNDKPGDLLDEWTALTRLEGHPAIPRAVSYEARQDWAVLTIERVLGARRLDDVARELGPDERARARLLLRLIDVTQFMESRGIEHRDLASGNIVVAPDESLSIIDFDQAVAVHPRDGVADVQPISRLRPLVPPTDHGDLLRKLGWEEAYAALARGLTEVWDGRSRARFSLDLWRMSLPGREGFWPRWHTLVQASEALYEKQIVLLGDDTGLFGVLALLTTGAAHAWVLGDHTTVAASACLAKLFGLEDRLEGGLLGERLDLTPDVLVSFERPFLWDYHDNPEPSIRAPMIVTEVTGDVAAGLRRLREAGWRGCRTMSAGGVSLVQAMDPPLRELP